MVHSPEAEVSYVCISAFMWHTSASLLNVCMCGSFLRKKKTIAKLRDKRMCIEVISSSEKKHVEVFWSCGEEKGLCEERHVFGGGRSERETKKDLRDKLW